MSEEPLYPMHPNPGSTIKSGPGSTRNLKPETGTAKPPASAEGITAVQTIIPEPLDPHLSTLSPVCFF